MKTLEIYTNKEGFKIVVYSESNDILETVCITKRNECYLDAKVSELKETYGIEH